MDPIWQEAMDANVGLVWIGETGGASLKLGRARAIPVGELKAAHESWFPPSWPPDRSLNHADGRPRYREPDQGRHPGRQGVTIRDLAGDGDHYAAEVVAESFRGKSRVQQHQMVYAGAEGQMGGVLHALALQTSVPE
jgi:stress-induced morphogen